MQDRPPSAPAKGRNQVQEPARFSSDALISSGAPPKLDDETAFPSLGAAAVVPTTHSKAWGTRLLHTALQSAGVPTSAAQGGAAQPSVAKGKAAKPPALPVDLPASAGGAGGEKARAAVRDGKASEAGPVGTLRTRPGQAATIGDITAPSPAVAAVSGDPEAASSGDPEGQKEGLGGGVTGEKTEGKETLAERGIEPSNGALQPPEDQQADFLEGDATPEVLAPPTVDNGPSPVVKSVSKETLAEDHPRDHAPSEAQGHQNGAEGSLEAAPSVHPDPAAAGKGNEAAGDKPKPVAVEGAEEGPAANAASVTLKSASATSASVVENGALVLPAGAVPGVSGSGSKDSPPPNDAREVMVVHQDVTPASPREDSQVPIDAVVKVDPVTQGGGAWQDGANPAPAAETEACHARAAHGPTGLESTGAPPDGGAEDEKNEVAQQKMAPSDSAPRDEGVQPAGIGGTAIASVVDGTGQEGAGGETVAVSTAQKEDGGNAKQSGERTEVEEVEGEEGLKAKEGVKGKESGKAKGSGAVKASQANEGREVEGEKGGKWKDRGTDVAEKDRNQLESSNPASSGKKRGSAKAAKSTTAKTSLADLRSKRTSMFKQVCLPTPLRLWFESSSC